MAWILTMTRWRSVRNDQGQDLIEYSLLALFLAVVLIGGVSLVGGAVDRLWLTIPAGISDGF